MLLCKGIYCSWAANEIKGANEFIEKYKVPVVKPWSLARLHGKTKSACTCVFILNSFLCQSFLTHLFNGANMCRIIVTYYNIPTDPNPAISAHVVFPQSGHIRTEKRPFFQDFPHFSKFGPTKTQLPPIRVQYIKLKAMKC